MSDHEKVSLLMTVDDYFIKQGEKVPCSVVIETKNRYEVLRLISAHGKFPQNDVAFLKFLDKLKEEDVIVSYKTSVMRLAEQEVWS